MSKKRKITLVVMIVFIAVVLAIVIIKSQKGNHQNTLQTINVSEVTRSVFYAPQYVAINNGYFEEKGLEIELSTGQGADAVMTSVLANQVEIGFAGPEASIYVYNEGKEDYTEVFAQLTKKDGALLVSRTNEENFRWENLKGKTVIPGRKGGVPYMTLEYVLKKNGINPETDVVLDDSIKFDLMAGAFAAGNADYVTLFEPTASLTEQEEKGYVVASVGEEAGEIPYTAYFAKKSYIEANKEIIQNFTDAIYEGQTWVKEHTAEEIATVIQDFFPDTSIDMLTQAIQTYKDIDAWNETPVLEKESFDRLQEVMTLAGELENPAPYDKVVNNMYAIQSIEN